MTRTTEEKDCQSALRQSCAADLENDMFIYRRIQQ
jgi:hypothetical protein